MYLLVIDAGIVKFRRFCLSTISAFRISPYTIVAMS